MVLAARRNTGERDVRQLEQNRAQTAVDRIELALETRDLVAQVATASDELVGGLLRALPPCDFLRIVVARCLSFLDGLDERAPLAIESLTAIDQLKQTVVAAATAHSVAQQVYLLAQGPRVVHDCAPVSPSGFPKG